MKFFELAKEGIKLRYQDWDKHEYIEIRNGTLITHKGRPIGELCRLNLDGWEIYELSKVGDLEYGKTFKYLDHKYTKIEVCLAIQNAIGYDKCCAMHIDNQMIAVFHGDVQVKPL